MIITSLMPVTKQKTEVEIDGQFAFVLYRGELSRFKLREQEEIPASVYREITEEILPRRAKLRAMHLLTRRDYTEQEIRQRLRKGKYPEEVIEEAVSYVKSYHYVDDESYARRYVEQYRDKKGVRKLRMELSGRGISREVTDRVLEEERPSEREIIRELVRKKWPAEGRATEKDFQRMYGFLGRRGFGSEDILAVLRELQRDSGEF